MLYSNFSVGGYKIIVNDDLISFGLDNVAVAGEAAVLNLSPIAWYTSEGVVLDGSGFVENLLDVSGSGEDAVKLSGDLRVLDGVLNGYPVIESKGYSMIANVDTRGLDGMTVLSVINDNLIAFSNYTYVPSGGFMLYRGSIHGRPDGSGYVQTVLQSSNDYAISTAIVKDGLMSHYVNGEIVSSISIGSFKVGASKVVLFGRPYVNTNSNSGLSMGRGAEVIIFDKVLSNKELDEVNGYLNNKYNLY